MNMEQALQAFIAESGELLEDMEQALLGVLQEDDPSDSVNAIFRAAHTIKGSAGLFGLDLGERKTRRQGLGVAVACRLLR
ncbi:hypothetical protein C8238_14715 [Paracidovorax avenae]|nr:Hpt domain-containing protein [Paracidovorax avenae]AVS89331.1 hypothetical protein C8238_14715 [Paracidovorax avenae]